MSLVTASSINFDLAPHHRVLGYYIYDVMDKDVASIRDLLVDGETRKPRYAMIEIGGFLAIRGKKILVPWGALKKGGMSRLDVNRVSEHIIAAPSPMDTERPSRIEEESIHRHFGVDPYWLVEQEEEEAKAAEAAEKLEVEKKAPATQVAEEPIGELKLERDS